MSKFNVNFIRLNIGSKKFLWCAPGGPRYGTTLWSTWEHQQDQSFYLEVFTNPNRTPTKKNVHMEWSTCE